MLWPGAHLAARLLDTNSASVRGRTVLALGAGTGLEALMAARLGAARVIACDISPLALALLRHGAEKAGLANVETQTFDLFSQDALPLADVLVCSDLLYNPELAAQVGRRCGEALTTAKQRGSSLSLLVTDSQRFSGGQTAFTKALLEHLPLVRAIAIGIRCVPAYTSSNTATFAYRPGVRTQQLRSAGRPRTWSRSRAVASSSKRTKPTTSTPHTLSSGQ